MCFRLSFSPHAHMLVKETSLPPLLILIDTQADEVLVLNVCLIERGSQG